MILNYREIISDAWRFAQENKGLMWWYSFMPSLLETTAGIMYVLYQFFSFKNSELFSGDESSSFIGQVIETSFGFLSRDFETGVVIAGIIAFLAVLYLFLPTLSQGGLMQLTARIHNNQSVRLGEGVYYGFISFLQLFEYHVLLRSFSLVTVFTELSFVARNLGMDWFKMLVWLFLFIGFVGLILSVLFIYAEYFIVVDRQGVINSIGESTKLVLHHWQETFLILVIMTIIGIQILVRVTMVILIPVIITFSTAYLVQFTILKAIGVYIGLGLGGIALLFASYLSGTIHVFATSVWVQTFLKLTSKEEKSARESQDKKEASGVPLASQQHTVS